MVRTVLLEPRVQNELSEWESSCGSKAADEQIGLLVGNVTEQHGYVLLAVRTPSLGDAGENAGSGRPEDWWIIEHGRHVRQTLPGGVDVIGLALACPASDAAKSRHLYLRGLLSKLCSPPSSPSSPSSPSTSTTGTSTTSTSTSSHPHCCTLLAHYCSKTKRLKCYTLDLSNPQAELRLVESKVQSHARNWNRLECVAALPLDLHFPMDLATPTTTPTMKQCMLAGIQPALCRFSDAVLLVRGKPCAPAEPLTRPQAQHKGHSSPAREKDPIQVSLLPRKPFTQPDKGTALLKNSYHIELSGGAWCHAYLHPRATCAEATLALNCDLARSLVARCELLCEEQALSEETSSIETPPGPPQLPPTGVKFQLPRRVLVGLPSSEVMVSGYCYQDESAEECGARTAELFGTPQPISVEAKEEETPPSQEDSCKAATSTSPNSPPPHPPPSPRHSKAKAGQQDGCTGTCVMVSGAVGAILLAVLVMWLMVGQQQ